MALSTEYDFAADLISTAQLYAASGWPVFPLHSPQHTPRRLCDCSLGNECQRAAKHPRTKNGLSDASTDEEQIARWWRMWPRANVGIAVPQGYVVLDIDGPDGLDALVTEGWAIPRTASVATAHGWHYWFTAQVEIRPGTKFLPHVDMRGPGSYVVAPPSLHATGVLYEWEATPLEQAIAAAPDWLYELVKRARERRTHDPSESHEGPIGDGQRNDTLTRIAGAMRRWGCSERAILAALEITNEERCVPPLPPDELRLIASSVARYAPENARQAAPHLWEREPW